MAGRVSRGHGWDACSHAFVQHAYVVVESIVGRGSDFELFTSAGSVNDWKPSLSQSCIPRFGSCSRATSLVLIPPNLQEVLHDLVFQPILFRRIL